MRAKANEFEKYFSEKYREDLSKIKKLVNSNAGKDFFLGVRENYLSIYYMGMSFAKVKALERGGCSYTLSYYYLKGVKDKDGNSNYDEKNKGYFSISSDMFWNKENFAQIKENVKEHVLGKGNSGHIYLEKACQQWIINSNNSNPKSTWYYVDMEYIYKEDGQEKDHPFGRADIIAISRKPDNKGLFQMAFVELKVGTGAYGISIKVPDKIKAEGNDKAEEYREKVKDLLKNDFWSEEIKGVKLGSGLASHVVDFMHFFSEDKAIEQLRKEVVGILKMHKQFDLINKSCPLYGLTSSDKIKKKPDIYIVTYSKAPDIEAQDKYEEPSLLKMKEQFAKYFFDIPGASSMSVEKLIKKYIQGLLKKKQDYLEFIKTDEKEIECEQRINNEPYRFVFRFLDLNKDKADQKKCIE